MQTEHGYKYDFGKSQRLRLEMSNVWPILPNAKRVCDISSYRASNKDSAMTAKAFPIIRTLGVEAVVYAAGVDNSRSVRRVA